MIILFLNWARLLISHKKQSSGMNELGDINRWEGNKI